MGKSLPSTAVLKNIARIFSSERITALKQVKPKSNNKVSASFSHSAKLLTKITPVDSVQLGLKLEGNSVVQNRFPLREVVSSCVKRWFRDTLKEAKAGDPAMQILVGQMYNSGYGVRKNTQKVSIFGYKIKSVAIQIYVKQKSLLQCAFFFWVILIGLALFNWYLYPCC